VISNGEIKKLLTIRYSSDRGRTIMNRRRTMLRLTAFTAVSTLAGYVAPPALAQQKLVLKASCRTVPLPNRTCNPGRA